MDGKDIQSYRKQFYRVRAEALAEALEMRNFEVHVCSDGEEAKDTALASCPKVPRCSGAVPRL